jgi:hypothetical protein
MRIIYQLPDGSRPGEMIAVNYFIPYYVNDAQSDIRGIECGWYTMDECGRLGSGPFSTTSECLESALKPRRRKRRSGGIDRTEIVASRKDGSLLHIDQQDR